MKPVTNRKYCKCHHCLSDIYSGDTKYIKRGKKFLCFKCGQSKKSKGVVSNIINKIYNWMER